MDQNLQEVARLLETSLDPTQHKKAELAIREHESIPGFSLAILHILSSSDSISPTTRLASSVYFKNFIKRNWTNEDGSYILPENEVISIKQQLIGLMISSPPIIQYQLGEAISVVADSDFWERWPTLVADLVSRLTLDNPVINIGVLQVAHSIFKRWRPLFRSDALYTEILHVLENFGKPFLLLMQNADQAITQNASNKDMLKQWFSCFNLIVKIFYDLSCQDLPPIFEENLSAIATLLHKYLLYDNSLLETDDESEVGVLEQMKTGIFEILILYTQKYEDAFENLIDEFVQSTWNLATSIKQDTKYDGLVCRALQFLATVVRIPSRIKAFNDVNLIDQVVEKVILPNIMLRESDVELFEDEPLDFIRRDVEGTESETRRRAATEFLRQLLERLESLVTNAVEKFASKSLAIYETNHRDNWKYKDTATYLFMSVAAKGTSTAAKGITAINPLVNVGEFFQKHVASDLMDASVHPILQIDSIRFLYVFRRQIPKEYWDTAFPLLVNLLQSSNGGVPSAAAVGLERIMSPQEDGSTVVSRDLIEKYAQQMMQQLFLIITDDKTPEKLQNNEFAMRCLMRIFFVMGKQLIGVSESALGFLLGLVEIIMKNPSNPRFYYFLFESIGSLVRFREGMETAGLEEKLFDVLSKIVKEDTAEFIPYVFQIIALFLECNPKAELSQYYTALLSSILQPPLWESKGNVPALVRLLSALIGAGWETILTNNQLVPILGVFQKLNATKSVESSGFDLIEVVITYFPAKSLADYFTEILQLMLGRLAAHQSAESGRLRSENYVLRFVRFYHLFSALLDKGLGADRFIEITDKIQYDVFRKLYTSIILPYTVKLTKFSDRKLAIISLTKTLADSEAFVKRYERGWGLTCTTLLKVLISGPQASHAGKSIGDELNGERLENKEVQTVLMEQDPDDLSFGVGFTQLTSCRVTVGVGQVRQEEMDEITMGRKPANDKSGGKEKFNSLKEWIGQTLQSANTRHSGRISNYVRERLDEERHEALVRLMSN